MKALEVYIDGASKGNPGPGGIGVVICRDGQTLKNISEYIGEVTNNIAEYTALIYALRECLMMKAEIVTINTDSELLCRQMNGLYKIKSPNILGLYNQSVHLVSGFKKVIIKHIPRTQNCGADKLATQCVKERFRNVL